MIKWLDRIAIVLITLFILLHCTVKAEEEGYKLPGVSLLAEYIVFMKSANVDEVNFGEVVRPETLAQKLKCDKSMFLANKDRDMIMLLCKTKDDSKLVGMELEVERLFDVWNQNGLFKPETSLVEPTGK